MEFGLSSIDLPVLFDNLLLNLCKLAGYVGSVTVKDGAIAVGSLFGVVEHDHLGREVETTRGRPLQL